MVDTLQGLGQFAKNAHSNARRLWMNTVTDPIKNEVMGLVREAAIRSTLIRYMLI